MALKDLAASIASVNEEAIESIIKNFVRFDVDARKLVLTGEAHKLTARQKILAFLTANEGWCYVDETISGSSLLPKELEIPLGIKGGSLRPALSKLQKDNMIRRDGSGYRIVSANLSRIQTEVLG